MQGSHVAFRGISYRAGELVTVNMFAFGTIVPRAQTYSTVQSYLGNITVVLCKHRNVAQHAEWIVKLRW